MMKKLFTLMLAAAATMTAQATDYTDKLLVLVNGEGSQQQATISVSEHDGLYDLNLKNFILMNGDSPMPVGNVQLTDITPEHSGNAIFLRASQNITVTEGDQEDVLIWTGPMLGELPVDVVAVLEDGQLRALINLDLMEMLQQMVEVRFGESLVNGKDRHIPNGDFEAWHTSSGNYQEPNAWHSFESASGAVAALAGHHIEKSDGGIGGSACARIYATSIFGIVANGTMTTGRMNAGALVASDPKNNAYLDLTSTDVDGNGDPFYVSLTSRPDSLVLWVKFKQGKANSAHPYATVSAVITDGTYYQDPEDQSYSNVVARAKNNQIAETGDQWQRLSIPFEYVSEELAPKAILVTVSTNADPGQGSANDEVLVDNLSLVYNSRLSALAVDGFKSDQFSYELQKEVQADALQPQADSRDAYVLTSVQTVGDAKCAVITVYAADLLSSSTYTVSFKEHSTAISEAGTGAAVPTAAYDLSGRRVSTPQAGQVTIVRQADGRVVKVRY